MFARARQLRVNDSSAVSLTTKKTLSRTALKTEFGEKLYFSINGNLVSKDLSCWTLTTVILERPTEEDKCEFVNEFGALYVNAGEEYVWSK